MKVTLDMTGSRAMLMHNVRLANPIDPWTQQLKSLTGKKKKTDEDLIAIMQTEARAGAYETSDGLLGLPLANVWRCIYDAATAFRRGADIKRSLSFEDVTVPLLVNGSTVPVDEFLSDVANIDYRPVSVQRAKTMRARPKVHGWSLRTSFELYEDVIDPRDLTPIVERAGRLVGVGDWRPIYGLFDSIVEVE